MARGPEIDFQETHEKRRRRRRYFFWFLIVVCIGVVIFGTWWLVLRSPLFLVQHINVTGNREIPEDAIVDLIKAKALRESSIKRWIGLASMFVWPETLTQDDLKPVPLARTVAIEKSYRERTITVTVAEREPYGIWCNMRNDAEPTQIEMECWWFDRDGVLFKKALAAEGNLIRVINDYSQKLPRLSEKILPERLISNLVSVLETLEQSSLSLKEVRLDDVSSESIEVRTNDGPKLLFSLRFPAHNTLAVIQKLFSAEGGSASGGKNLQYIDFTVENRAYYK